MPGQQFFYSCVSSSLFAGRIVIFVLSQRDIATAYHEHHAYFIVGEILGALKKIQFQSPLQKLLGSIMAAPGACHPDPAMVQRSLSILVP